jgi:ribosome-associated heat shock protein Hsp15
VPDDSPPPDRQRIDKWLWHARVVRTRSAAAALAASGRVRLNGARIDAASRPVKVGDTVTVALDGGVRVLHIRGFAQRRGDAEAARVLYDEERGAGRSPADRPDDSVTPVTRDAGAGRPTKRDRRALDRLRDES